MARSRKKKSIWKSWTVRLLLAVALGLPAGALLGMYGINTLEPPGQHPDAGETDIESDSALLSRAAASIRAREMARQQLDAQAAAEQSAAATAAGATVSIPDLTDLEEGHARALLEELGFEVGQVMFRGSPKPIGTVLSTFPVKGERVVLPTTVNLILSNGRGRRSSG